jgi:4-hydroxybenzoate polyprenyltransferase
MISFLRLVRFVNLLIVCATILGVAVFHAWINDQTFLFFLNIDFILFITSTLLITAAGNIINDYFDIKADQVNKPNRLIVSKKIKRRWAIVLHLSFNGLAFIISVYLSIKYKSISLLIIPTIAINMLWIYSWYLKKKLIIGNISIAVLTALVPVLTTIYLNQIIPFYKYELVFIYFISISAFIQNLVREIIKDAEDVVGDKLINVNSIPIYFGHKATKIICICLLFLFPLFIYIGLIEMEFIPLSKDHIFILLPIFISAILNLTLISFIVLQDFNHLRLYNSIIKLTLLLGLSLMFIIPIVYESSYFRIIFTP